jgi:CDGSH-type Zn-finger protein
VSLHATGLRVRRHEAGGAPPELAEAVAALQDVACALAPAAGGAAARAAQLRELQASLPAGVQTAHNGPYLVTNGPDIRTPLGLPLPLPPQVALCRCGGSARKPFCDGAFFGWDAPQALARAVASGPATDQAGARSTAVPRWDWTAAGPPGPDGASSPGRREPEQPVTLPGPDEPVSFAAHIKPMFRPKDRQSMLFTFDLWSYDDVRGQATGILERLSNGTMPCDGAWPGPQVDVFRRWAESGTPA